MSATGGKDPQPLTLLDTEKGETAHGHPVHLPSGKAVLMAVYLDDDASIAVLSLETGNRKPLVKRAHNARYLEHGPHGYLLFGRHGVLYAQRFDADRLELIGEEFAVVDDLGMDWAGSTAQFGISDHGTLVYAPGPRGYQSPTDRLAWVDRNGAIELLPVDPGSYRYPTIAAEGERAVVSLEAGQLTVVDLVRGACSPLSASGSPWANHGPFLYFGSSFDGRPCIMRTNLAETGEPEVLHLGNAGGDFDGGSISSDGRFLAYVRSEMTAPISNIWVLPLDGDSRPQLFLDTPHRETSPTFSPDGKWLGYMSNQTGRREIYVLPYPPTGRPAPISTQGGYWPKWSPDGAEIFYCRGDKMMAVAVATEPAFVVGETRILFEGRYRYAGGQDQSANYDYDGGSERFLIVKPSEDRKQAEGATQLTVVRGFVNEIERRAR